MYRGFDLPEGSMVVPNIWFVYFPLFVRDTSHSCSRRSRWMTQNPEVYSKPENFDPDRYLRMSTDESERMDPRNIVFGFGRRFGAS